MKTETKPQIKGVFLRRKLKLDNKTQKKVEKYKKCLIESHNVFNAFNRFKGSMFKLEKVLMDVDLI